MIEYLSGQPLSLPVEVGPTSDPLEEGLGTITPSFKQGDLFLTDSYGMSFRLSWTGEESEKERALALPAGEYVLRTYRIVREDAGVLWHTSATRPSIRHIQVDGGDNVNVEVDDAIHMSSRLSGGRAQMMIKGEHGAGLSIYRAGKRIPIEFRLLGDDGAVLASGSMRYG